MNLMKAESAGPSVSKLVPKVQSTAKILYTIYIILTVVEIIFLLRKMPLFYTPQVLVVFGILPGINYGLYDSFWNQL